MNDEQEFVEVELRMESELEAKLRLMAYMSKRPIDWVINQILAAEIDHQLHFAAMFPGISSRE